MDKIPAADTFGEAIRRRRQAKGWTQEDLAYRAALAPNTIGLLGSGGGNLASLKAVLDALGLFLRCPGAPPGQTLPAVLTSLRRRRGVSLADLSRRVGVAAATIRTLGQGGSGRVSILERVLRELEADAHLIKRARPRKGAYYQATAQTDRWNSPDEILAALYTVFSFDLDPCSPTRFGPVRARRHFTSEDDGLSHDWSGVVYCNPPYGRGLATWIAKAREEYDAGRAKTVVLLIPSATGTAAWHDWILRPDSTIYYLRGRLRYGGHAYRAPFPSALIVWGASRREISALDKLIPGRRG